MSSREIDGEWIILDLRHGRYFGLDEIGGAIWRHLSSGRTPSEIATLLRGMYDVAEATLVADIVALADDLLEKDLVRLDE